MRLGEESAMRDRARGGEDVLRMCQEAQQSKHRNISICVTPVACKPGLLPAEGILQRLSITGSVTYSICYTPSGCFCVRRYQMCFICGGGLPAVQVHERIGSIQFIQPDTLRDAGISSSSSSHLLLHFFSISRPTAGLWEADWDPPVKQKAAVCKMRAPQSAEPLSSRQSYNA